jgi:hypothetical protein
MSVESRRSPRLIDYLPLEVHVVHVQDGHLLAGPFAGRIIDISMHGACLLMSQMMHNRFHVFHSTRDNEHAMLRLTINHPPELDRYTIIARPVWMDLFHQQEIRAFKMGVEFTEDAEKDKMQELQQALRANQPQRSGWWQQHCHLFHSRR